MTSFLPDGRVMRGVVIGHKGAEPVCGECIKAMQLASLVAWEWEYARLGAMVPARIDEVTA